ncbi:hypothetical protein BZA77DRAFT_312673 [Pyronema omphalodes]|nr:hypothetical protein BZA77DRAFT_312673 [Pyronema omphalodes]
MYSVHSTHLWFFPLLYSTPYCQSLNCLIFFSCHKSFQYMYLDCRIIFAKGLAARLAHATLKVWQVSHGTG